MNTKPELRRLYVKGEQEFYINGISKHFGRQEEIVIFTETSSGNLHHLTIGEWIALNTKLKSPIVKSPKESKSIKPLKEIIIEIPAEIKKVGRRKK